MLLPSEVGKRLAGKNGESEWLYSNGALEHWKAIGDWP